MKDLRINVTEKTADNILKKLYSAGLEWNGGGQSFRPRDYPRQLLVNQNKITNAPKAFFDSQPKFASIPEVDTIPNELKIRFELSDILIGIKVVRYSLNGISVIVCDDADQIVKIQLIDEGTTLDSFTDESVIKFAWKMATAKPGELVIPAGDTDIINFLKAARCLQ